MTTSLPNVGQYFYQTLDNNFVSRLEIPENNLYLLHANIHNDYPANHVWSKCGRKHGFGVIDHSRKSLSYNTLHHICGRVVEIFRKQKIYEFQIRKPYRLFKTIVISYTYISLKDTAL